MSLDSNGLIDNRQDIESENDSKLGDGGSTDSVSMK